MPSGCSRLTIAEHLAIGVLWCHCVKLRDLKSEPEKPDVNVELSPEDDERLKQLWWNAHGYTLPSAMLLESTKMAKMLKGKR